MDSRVFVDWDGHVRSFINPGDGFHCIVGGTTSIGVDFAYVCTEDKHVIFEAVIWNSFEELRECIPSVKFETKDDRK